MRSSEEQSWWLAAVAAVLSVAAVVGRCIPLIVGLVMPIKKDLPYGREMFCGVVGRAAGGPPTVNPPRQERRRRREGGTPKRVMTAASSETPPRMIAVQRGGTRHPPSQCHVDEWFRGLPGCLACRSRCVM